MAFASVTSLTIPTPVGTIDGDLLVAAMATTYSPTGSIATPCPGAVPVIVPPAGWTTMLADFPGGENSMGDLGSGPECDRLAVFWKIAASEPPTHTFDWSAGGSVSAAGFIKNFTAVDPATPINVAAPSALVTLQGVNPMPVDAPSVVTTQPNCLLLCIFVARNGSEGLPGGGPFVAPGSMLSMVPALNLATFLPPTNPFGIAMFQEIIPTPGATGIRTATVPQNRVPPNPLQGMGYSFCVAGICT